MPIELFLFILFFSFVFSIIDLGRWISPLKIKILFLLELVLLIVVSTIKDENTSSDTLNYIRAFYQSNGLSSFFSTEVFYYEPGYTLLQAIYREFSLDYPVLFFTIALFTLGIIGYALLKYSPYPLFSLFIYVCVFYFKRDIVIIRYSLSCALLFLALFSLCEQNIKKAFCWAGVASLFHYTALSFPLFYVFYIFFKNRMNVVESLLLLFLVLSFLHITILTPLIKIQPLLPGFFSFALSKGLKYLDTDGVQGYKQIIQYIPFLLYAIILKLRNVNRLMYTLYVTFLFSIFMMIELNQANTFNRINQMYLTVIILLIPIMYSCTRRLSNRALLLFLTYIFSFYTLIRMTFFNTGGSFNLYY